MGKTRDLSSSHHLTVTNFSYGETYSQQLAKYNTVLLTIETMLCVTSP